MRVINEDDHRLPIFNWSEDTEEQALQQAKNLASLPFAFHHIALMPDCHVGYGMPIGGVMACKNVVVPNAVGVDIGCGMLSVKTNIQEEEVSKEMMQRVFGGSKEYKGGIRSLIPVGFNHHSKKQDDRWMPKGVVGNVVPVEYDSALKQIGTLGGGNHFIEFQIDEEGFMWFTVHSGSRNIGKKVAEYYNSVAVQQNDLWFSSVDKSLELAFIPSGSQFFQEYMMEMQYCVDFALRSRKLMATNIMAVLSDEFHGPKFDEPINIAHNYAALENHFGNNVIVHRKGATLAREGTIGIIPGSQGSHTYIVRGNGNPKSFMSCSHGAGRAMGRKAAQKNLNLADEQNRLDSSGLMIHAVRNEKDLDEAPGAYKSIERVMGLQSDLIEIVHTLRPIACMKG